jgi:hypothetical protein
MLSQANHRPATGFSLFRQEQITVARQRARNTKTADQVTTVGHESHYVKRK